MNPSCEHGERKYVTGTSAKGPWFAYMCPTPKGTPGQCPPEWIKGPQEAPRGSQAASSAATDLLASIDSKLSVLIELARENSLKDNPLK